MTLPLTPLKWVSDHWTELGIGTAIMGFLYRLHRTANKGKKYLSNLVNAQDSIELIKTNHLPHLQIELEKINSALGSINQTLAGTRDDARGFRDDLRALLVK